MPRIDFSNGNYHPTTFKSFCVCSVVTASLNSTGPSTKSTVTLLYIECRQGRCGAYFSDTGGLSYARMVFYMAGHW